jgi:hypothetical protein
MASKAKKKTRLKLPEKRCTKITKPKKEFSKEFGFRYIPGGKGTVVMIGCPKGKSKTQKSGCKTTKSGKKICGRRMVCTVGTRSHAVIKARRGSSCPTGYKAKSR